jgi:transposase
MPINILNLSAYEIANFKETEHDYHIFAKTKVPSSICPRCGSKKTVGHGSDDITVKDLPIHGRRVGVYIGARRYKCRDCGKTFTEALPHVNSKRLMTDRLVQYVGAQALSRTFTSIADDIGVAEGTIRNIFRDYVNELEKTVRFEIPQWMGIDEIHIIKKPRAVISNIKNNTIVNILPDRNKKTVIKYLNSLDGKNHVRYVAMDMWNPYRDAVNTVFPDATIVIDKFHVVRMANEAVEKVRKSIRQSLTPAERRTLMHDRFVLLKRQKDLTAREQLLQSTWFANFQDLEQVYKLKEQFFNIWEAKDKSEALALFNGWKQSIPQNLLVAYHPLITATENWQEEIFAYFDHKITNAYTESLNNLIRVMNRLGRGYSFAALRAKILFTESMHKVKRPAFGKQPTSNLMGFRTKSTLDSRLQINYGVDISTLTELIESGTF